MAWTARIDSIAAGPSSTIIVAVGYFDATDTGFTTPLASRTFSLLANAPLAETKQQIVQWGQEQRAYLNRLNTAAANWTGATVNIP